MIYVHIYILKKKHNKEIPIFLLGIFLETNIKVFSAIFSIFLYQYLSCLNFIYCLLIKDSLQLALISKREEALHRDLWKNFLYYYRDDLILLLLKVPFLRK